MKKRQRGRTTEVLLLKDLAPREDVKGGGDASKRVFGDVNVGASGPERPANRKRKRK